MEKLIQRDKLGPYVVEWKAEPGRKCFLAMLIFLGLGIGLLGAIDQAFRLEKVFEFKIRSWKDWPVADLSPVGAQIYLLQESKVHFIDVKSRRIIASASYEDIPCNSAVKLQGWDLVPSKPDILVTYCGSLLLVDRATLKVKRRLLPEPLEMVGGLAISPTGEHIAAAVYRPGAANFAAHTYVAVVDTENWDVVHRWPIFDSGLSFSTDGKLLAIGRTKTNEQKWVVSCGVEIRRVDSGELLAEWWRDASGPCPGRQPLFVPGDSNTFLTLDLTYVDFDFWDVKSGEIKRHISSPRPVHSFLFSLDGKWLIADVANDPQDTPEYNQDFIVWDLASGAILYESPKMKWNLFETFAKAEERSELQLNNLSLDGRFLLVTRYKRLEIYEINDGRASTKARPTLPL